MHPATHPIVEPMMTTPRFLSRDGVAIQYELSGDGTPVLFIQGVGVTGEGWRPQIQRMHHGFATLTFDNRGIGRSIPCTGRITIEAMAEDAAALLDVAGWNSAHVVGHSMGGVIAQQLALAAPARVRSLSLLCTFVRGRDAARLSPWILWMTLRTRLGTPASRRRAFLEMLAPKDMLRDADTAALASEIATCIGRDLAHQPPTLLQQLRALSRHDSSVRLHELAKIPTLVISARHDRIALPRFGQMLAAAIPGAHYEEFAGASHGVNILQADAITERLTRFLNLIEGQRAGS